MKILHVNDTYAMTGGIPRYLFDVAALLEGQGHENVIVYRREHERTPRGGRMAYHVPEAVGQEQLLKAMERIVEEKQPDVAYLHAVYDPALVARVSTLLPAVAYVHGFHTVCPGLAKFYRRSDVICERPFGLGCIPMIYLRRCSDARDPRTVWRIMRATAEHQAAYQQLPRVLVASNYMRRLLLQNGYDESRVTTLPQPLEPVPPESYAARHGNRILYAGRLEIEKGVPYLLRAAAQLRSPFALRIAGDGSLQRQYEGLAEELGLAERVRFLGWLDDDELDDEFRKSALLVMPSICPESFGQAGVQAMLRCRPVVAFDVGGISDWLKDGWNGFLVPPLDVEQLAARIETVLNNPDLAARLGRQGREYVVSNYAPERHLGRLLTVFRAVRNGWS